MKSKGFTLIELIVSIAIMGILLIITIPQVSKIQKENKEKKYETYKTSIEKAAKLYTDSNSKDMFGYNNSGCERINYETLKKANLIKDIQIEDITCDDPKTYVEVRKINEEYDYNTSVICKKKSNQSIVYKNVLTGECENVPDTEPPEIKIGFTSNNGWVKEVPTITVTISDISNLYKNTEIKYYFAKKDNTNIPIGKTYTKDFNNKSNVGSVSFSIPKKNTPTSIEGEIILVVVPVNVRDMLNNVQTNNKNSNSIKIDLTPPTVNLNINDVTTVTGNAADKYSGIKSYYFGTTECSKVNDSSYINSNLVNISTTKTDGNKYYLCVKDNVNLVGSKSITSYKKCSTKTYGSWLNSGTCNVNCGGGTQNQTRETKDSYTGESCGNENKQISCNTQGCCSSTENYSINIYTFDFDSKSCNGTDKYRKYQMHQYKCDCKKSSFKKQLCSSSVKETTKETHPTSWNKSGGKYGIMTVHYRNNINGTNACNNDTNVNSYISGICNEEDNFSLSNINPEGRWHGYYWYYGEVGEWNNFGPVKDYWYHNSGKYDTRIKRSGTTPTAACEYSCKIEKNIP